ncbi:hypothetical protein SAMN05421640_3465 [Ekhidna lutea]|uniref:Uncharacterized protein n=1 Tax=Ekhidna lutea TaxID=447679 RepID=A0A239LZI3_EKHLU|nr:hypothetical protein [Ekhidna lutea]SNT35089.1 hypothetical protein SAMN05421640_3465 [Ekhidna lutea]
MNKILASLATSLLLCSCMSQKQTQAFEAIKFGTAGGFTGKATGHQILLIDGSVRPIEGERSLENLSENEVELLAQQIEDVIDMSYDEPANMYKFIEIITSGKDTIRFRWGVNDEAPPKIENLFKSLTSLTSK